MNIDEMSEKELVEFIRKSGVDIPQWLIDMKPGEKQRPLTREQQLEFAEIHSIQLRSCAALYYIGECIKRFGRGPNGQFIFCHENIVVEIDKPVIEKLLKTQIEDVLIDEDPEDKYLSVMKFYKRDEINRKRSTSPWLVDFIDEVLIACAEEMLDSFIDTPKSKQIH
ncbi:hypothetical protein [Symbiopectobacterium purcellii]|uniref:hypothetical protein n=1 Tax=Symbiopectobacterium purcellii TaxID=2871826 RepID=UPI003F85127A